MKSRYTFKGLTMLFLKADVKSKSNSDKNSIPHIFLYDGSVYHNTFYHFNINGSMQI